MRNAGTWMMGMRRLIAVVALVVVAATIGAVASSIAPSLTGAQVGGQIHGCVNNFTGGLRITYAAGLCSSSERSLSWDQQNGGGIVDIQVVEESQVVETEDQDESAFVGVACPPGYRVLGGGAGLGTTSGNDIWAMTLSEPSISEGWRAIFRTVDGEDAEGFYSFFAKAVCVSIG